MSEEEFGELRSLAGGADALAHLGHGGSDGLGEVAVAVGAGVDAGAAADAVGGIVQGRSSGTLCILSRELTRSVLRSMPTGHFSAQRPHMRQTGSGMGTKPVFG